MPHHEYEYNTWLSVDDVMPEKGRFYWVSDSKDNLALAEWNIKDMCWKYRFMVNVFTPEFMMPIKLQKPSTINKELQND